MPGSRHTSSTSGPRLLAALALTAALTATGVTAVKEPAGAVPGAAMTPVMATVDPSTWTGPGTPVPTVTANPSQSPLAPPTNVAVAGVTSTSVTLTWTAPARGEAVAYPITYRSRFSDVIEGVTVGNVTTATITSLGPARDYIFWLSARDAAGNTSNAASPITVVTLRSDTGPDTTPPSTPTNFRAESGGALSWGPSTDNAGVVGYDVYWFDGWYRNRLLATVTGTSYTATYVGGTSSNYYYVRARDAAGNVSIATDALVPGATTTTPPPSSSAPPPPGCRVTYQPTAEWQRGFAAQLTITNTGQEALDGWTLTFSFSGDQRVLHSWNSTFSQAGADVTMKNLRWNGRIAPGESATVGMVGSRTATTAATPPTSFALNGRPCTVR